ncbi:uncharacterized protein LOC116195908 [Punica granatum]|nr:uncharacterized protein LOC116195908 [Punica granatum]XP_031381186.1 uncharacterized protein LOC116195908 [Punica granatum]XP_031381187.1 uncharacterized protein LOC116195908 [Punica granatum]XP_031381188.1 uncharacterized protein LOC116195908 [Punica granatum]PKI34903.1 hypothetical protein CRG98_044749 [Punica granatum]
MQDGFSAVDGFVEITESLAEMIKYVANEPSVGLFYIQQHTQNAVPNVINLKNKVGLKSHETTLHTEDAEDSIAMVKSMKDCGLPIADEMIADIKKSLSIMSVKQPKKGLISPASSFQMGRSRSLGPSSWGWSNDPEDGERKGGYFSSVFKSAKQKAGNFRWPQLDHKGPMQMKDEKEEKSMSNSNEMLLSSSSTLPGGESDELPLSSQVTDELPEGEGEGETTEDSVVHNPPLPFSEEYDSFKANREAKLEEWLEGNGKRDNVNGASA